MAQEEEGTTPGAIADPGSYQGSMQLQQQEQQQSQQQEQQNQQMLGRLNQNYQQYRPNAAGGAQGRSAPAVNWWSRPALAPEHNPLLGRWHQVASKGVSLQHAANPLAGLLPTGAADSVNSMVDSTLAGGCKSMFGSGVIAFEPAALQWVAPDGHEEILNNVAYRANGVDVIVLTKDPGAVPALIFGFPDHDRAVVAFFNCTMDRVGAKPHAAAAAAPAASATSHANVAATGIVPAGPANSVLELQAAAGAPGHVGPLTNVQFWVTPENPVDALQAVGAAPARGASLGEFLNEDCRNPASCVRDWNAMTGKALGSVRTDTAGHARTPPIPAGRYYIVGMAPDLAKPLFWSLPVDARPGMNPVMLSPANGTALHK